MSFNPGIKIGDKIRNNDIVRIFKCGNMSGMRRSKKTGTLVIICDGTKDLYKDRWINGVLHYTGMGKVGDQKIEGNQNKTLKESNTNGVEVHLFEVLERTIYTYLGVVVLAADPYNSMQKDENGRERRVWIFPLKLVSNARESIKNIEEKEVIKLSSNELIKRAENSALKESTISEIKVYYRDPYLKELVKRLAGGKCQYCGKKAPFKDKNGNPYLEEHHVKRLADGGSDEIGNIVAICPNCHRKFHVLNDEIDIVMLEGIAQHNQRQYERLLAYGMRVNESNEVELYS